MDGNVQGGAAARVVMTRAWRVRMVALPFLCVAWGLSGGPHAGGGQGVVADHAMVVTAHPLATEVGLQVLREGGNAIDAAVAVHHALAVVLPWAGNIGGGGFMLVRMADGTVSALDFRETAPASASRDMYLGEDGNVVPGLSVQGHKAAGVPGAVAGLCTVHDSLGRMPMERLVRPAIELARNGFPLTEREAEELVRAQPLLRKHSTRPGAYTARDDWRPGDTLRLPALAATLERIRDHGREGFYAGPTADLIVAEMERGGGLITREDLAAYGPVWRTPVRGTYRGVNVYSMPPPSSGGTILLQLLKAMEPMDVAGTGWQRAPLVHRMAEVGKRAFADHASYFGDADFVEVPLEGLLDSLYVLDRMADIDPERATPGGHVEAGDPPGREETTHFSIVDAEGNAVSCTTTLNGMYGSYVVVGGAGFILNNEMDDFSAAPGAPNSYGLVGGEANAIAPGKRMLSSMTPTIVTKDDRLFMVVGTPGGSTIITTVFQTLLNVVDHGMGMQQAVSAPRFHQQWRPDIIQMEAGAISPEDSLVLSGMGHELRVRRPIGRADAILVLPDGRLEGGADPRGDDHAAGY